VMPISTVPSFRSRTHSCVRVYLRSAGTLLMSCTLFRYRDIDARFAIANEWGFDDGGIQQLAADIHLHAIAGLGRNAREGDGSLERRRERAAGGLALADSAHHHFLVAAQNTAILQQQADELQRRAALADRLERAAPDEIARRGLE